MAEFRIAVDLSAVIEEAGNVVNERVLPLLSKAVRDLAEQTASNWAEAVQRAKLWSGERDAYVASIQWKETGPFSALVWSDYKHAEEIEKGRPARDLKEYLNTSHKVRLAGDGKRYLIIPFRHNTPGNGALARAMPKSVYAIAKTLTFSRDIGKRQRVSGLQASDIRTRGPLMVTRTKYLWGESLPDGHGRRLRAHHRTDQYAGMYRFQTTTPGGKTSSEYLTFRVMKEGQQGWIIPPKAGLHLAENVAREMAPLAEKAFNDAIRAELGG